MPLLSYTPELKEFLEKGLTLTIKPKDNTKPNEVWHFMNYFFRVMPDGKEIEVASFANIPPHIRKYVQENRAEIIPFEPIKDKTKKVYSIERLIGDGVNETRWERISNVRTGQISPVANKPYDDEVAMAEFNAFLAQQKNGAGNFRLSIQIDVNDEAENQPKLILEP